MITTLFCLLTQFETFAATSTSAKTAVFTAAEHNQFGPKLQSKTSKLKALKDFDFLNATFVSTYKDENNKEYFSSFTFKNGQDSHYQKHNGSGGTTISVDLYHDFTGDGVEEAVIIWHTQKGMWYGDRLVQIYTLETGKPTLLASIHTLAAKGVAGSVSVSASGKDLVLDDQSVQSTWKFDGTVFTSVVDGVEEKTVVVPR